MKTSLRHVWLVLFGSFLYASQVQATDDPRAAPVVTCGALANQTIATALIGLPTSGASVQSATLVAPSPQVVNPNGTTTLATPEYCRVLGVIAPIDPSAPSINFQVNLPTAWNQKAMQFGGGGFNGVLVTGLGAAPSAPPGAPLPITRGYATFGTDSGHQAAALAEPQAFALNDEALVNFAYASYKKTRDVAVELVRRYYGFGPRKTYYVGSSEGGREGLTVAQRYPADYDGVFSRVPVINWVALQSAGTRTGGIVQQGGGWLPPAKVALVHDAVLAACDTLDGLADGVVSKYEGCGDVFNPATLRCPGGQDTGNTCLSDAQINTVNTVHSPFEFNFSLANGLTFYPGWGFGGENNPGQWTTWTTGTSAPTFPPSPGNGFIWTFGNGVIRYFIARDPNFNPFTYSPDDFRARVREVSELMDSTNPDLSAFHRRGGKLILLEYSSDYAQSGFAGINYYQAVIGMLGKRTTDRFVRLYVAPGLNHGGIAPNLPNSIDMVQLLEEWVEEGEAPEKVLVQTLDSPTPPFTSLASRPLCHYPSYPQYIGGDPNSATSFKCQGLSASHRHALERFDRDRETDDDD